MVLLGPTNLRTKLFKTSTFNFCSALLRSRDFHNCMTCSRLEFLFDGKCSLSSTGRASIAQVDDDPESWTISTFNIFSQTPQRQPRRTRCSFGTLSKISHRLLVGISFGNDILNICTRGTITIRATTMFAMSKTLYTVRGPGNIATIARTRKDHCTI